MTADLLAFRSLLEAELRAVLPDPRDAGWLSILFLSLLRENLAGQKIPSRYALNLAEAEARAAELLPLGAAVVAERGGCHRSTAYRRASRFRLHKIA